MILTKIDYYEFDRLPDYWTLKEVKLEKTNLFIGKNATGKTRSITAITRLACMLKGLQANLSDSRNFNTEFSDNTDIYQYSLHIGSRSIHRAFKF
ncbi:hypothetical protein FACS1894164_20690 [Spirochaetia bacterium]|nr:hypothetical protein FACS1894164_20690 [Spirochaetia bacterium]